VILIAFGAGSIAIGAWGINNVRDNLGQEQIVFGDRAQEIIRHATQSGTSVIVLTSRRVDMTHPGAGWGALSFKLSLLSQCPILLVK
jgi:hypothetical protein